ncbi:hypothetical protein [Arcticibacter tournemirensis]
MNKGRLPAFTILEVTIAMLLAGITIGIAYTAYTVVGRSYSEYDLKNKKVAEFVLLNKLLKKDIAESEKAVRLGEGISLEGARGTIQYAFSPAFITRNQHELQTDTFYVKNSNLLMTFEDKPTEEGKLADKISFTAELEGSAISMAFTKQYSSEDLFEQD